MKLSKDFTLEEFLISQTAERNDIDMTPPPAIVDNLQRLVGTCLQPLRTDLGVPIVISSGYRPLALNRLIGGSPTSAHPDGRAADFRAIGLEPIDVCRRIRELGLPYDQNIHEFGKWTHLGIAVDEPSTRGEDLTAYRRSGHTRYVLGLETMAELAA